MTGTDLGAVIALLRTSRGWNQAELAKASGVPGSAVSDYERGKTVPELATLERLVAAMGYPLGAVDQARAFVAQLRWQATRGPGVPGRAGSGSEPAELTDREVLRRELDQIFAAAGDLFTWTARVVFALMAGAARGGLPPTAQPAVSSPPPASVVALVAAPVAAPWTAMPAAPGACEPAARRGQAAAGLGRSRP